MTPHYACVTRAARLVAAIKADDKPGMFRVMAEVKDDREATRQLVVALATRVVQLADQVYGDRCQDALDSWAFGALSMTDLGERPGSGLG